MKIKLHPSHLSGNILPPPSKSITHRALICAGFASGSSIIRNPLIAEDTLETISVLENCGALIKYQGSDLIVEGRKKKPGKNTFLIKESASTLRMLLPLLSTIYDEVIIKTTPRLIERIDTDDLKTVGLDFRFENDEIRVRSLNQKYYQISTELTSQWLSGLILALPYLPENSSIESTSGFLEPYIHLTISTASFFKARYQIFENTIKLKERSIYQGREIAIEKDYAAAANWLVASYFHRELVVQGLNPDSIQADALILPLLRKLGLEYSSSTYQSGKIRSAKIDVSKTPDLFPILASLASLGDGTVIITGLDKLKYKESNRLEGMVAGLKRLGAKITKNASGIIFQGVDKLEGGIEIKTDNDHRLIMAYAILATKLQKPIVLDSFLGVKKSYPDFFNDYQKLGGKVEII